MRGSQMKVCKMPVCKKETFNEKTVFCGEHDREFKAFLSGAKKITGGITISALVYIAKKMFDKKS